MTTEENEFHFLEGEKIVLPDTHEWINVTTYSQSARGETHFIQGVSKLSSDRKYTIEEVKSAFWREFHKCGERWFAYNRATEEENEEYTEIEWQGFLQELEKDE